MKNLRRPSQRPLCPWTSYLAVVTPPGFEIIGLFRRSAVDVISRTGLPCGDYIYSGKAARLCTYTSLNYLGFEITHLYPNA